MNRVGANTVPRAFERKVGARELLQAQHVLMNPAFHGPTLLAGGTDGPEGSVLVVLSEALIIVLVAIIYRQRKFPLITDPARVETLRENASTPEIGIS